MITVGILGAGQLAQLLAHSAYQLGVNTLCFADSADCPAARLSPIHVGDMQDEAALKSFADTVDVITFENENIDEAVIDFLCAQKPLYPPKKAIITAQDRLLEKQLFDQLSIPCAPYRAVDSVEALEQAIDALGVGILKTRRLGYDGKGQFRISDTRQGAEAFAALGSQDLVYEGLVNFQGECSQLAARDQDGNTAFYPLVENVHREGILRTSICPALDQRLSEQAQASTQKLLDELDYVGLLAVEFFVDENGLVANEIAPRVHNSGHVTIEACNASQFENHLRAVTGKPLVEPIVLQSCRMENIIGEFNRNQTDGHLYYYGKTPRPGRKLGHITQAIVKE